MIGTVIRAYTDRTRFQLYEVRWDGEEKTGAGLTGYGLWPLEASLANSPESFSDEPLPLACQA